MTHDSICLIKLELDQVDIWREDLESVDSCKNIFGNLGFILHEYYQEYDFRIFKKYKKIIESEFIDAVCSTKPVSTFFGRLDKILMLSQYWDENQSWRDPLVARPREIKNNKNFYFVHPGRDRYCVMRSRSVKNYPFLCIPSNMINESNTELIKSFWGEYKDTVIIKPSKKDPTKFSLGNHDTDQYTKYTNLANWLKQ